MAPSDPARDDPFLHALRHRHPDVDVMLLPSASEEATALPPAGPDTCRSVQRHADAVLATLAGRLDLEPGGRVDFWWQQRHPLVRRWVTRTDFRGPAGRGTELLRTLGQALLDLGWDARPVGDDPPRLRAVAGSVDLIGTGRSDGLTVELRSEPLHVTSEVLAALAGTEPGR